MKVIDTSGMSREQWLTLRRQGIGASDAPVICGLSNYKTRFQLWLEKTGQMEPEEAGEAARWGLRFEDDISAELTEEYNVKIQAEQVMVEHPEIPWMTATLDMVESPTEVWQYKCGGIYKTGDLVAENPSTLPEDWVVQSHHEMIAAEVDHVNYAVFIGHRMCMWTFRLDYDPVVADQLMPLLEEFRYHVESCTPPPTFDANDVGVLSRFYRGQKGPPVESDDPKLIELASQYEVADSTAKFQEELAKQIKANLMGRMGPATFMKLGAYEVRRIDCHKKPEKKPRDGYDYTQVKITKNGKPLSEND